MAFLNTFNLPANGYQVYVPETNYSTRPYTGLEDTVKELVIHRQGNPRFGWPTDEGSVRAWVLNSVEARLRAMPGGAGMQWLVQDSPPPDPGFLPLPRKRQPGRAELERTAADVNPKPVEQVKNTLAGIALWLDWFGDKPVEQPVADSRAACCARCSLNEKDGNPLAQFNEAAAKEILAIFASLKHKKLQTPHDDMLGVCAACTCPLRAKVWSPLKLVLKHLRPEAREKLWSECWILREEKALTPQLSG